MANLRHRLALALLCLTTMGAPRSTADITPVPLASSQIGQEPFKFTGQVLAGIDFGGSGAVIRHPNIVVSCAHVVYDEESWLDPWLGDVRWFWKYHDSADPSWSSGKALRGYTKFTGYQPTAESYGVETPDAFAWDVVAHFAYESLAEGEYGGGWINGPSALRSLDPKMITGYPSSLYPDGHANLNKMHVTGPFTAAMTVARGAYLRTEGVAVAGGNSGGPVWVRNAAGSWLAAGVAVATAAKASGDPVNLIGVRALDADAWALVSEAIGVAPPPNDDFAAAIAIGGTTDRVTGANVGATQEASEPDHADDPGGKSVWWTWTSPNSGTVVFDTVGSSFDTVLAVYIGDEVGSLTPIANDDESGGDGAGRVTFTAVAGTVYHIAVDGYSAASGTIVLNQAQPPENDDFASRTAWTAIPATLTSSNVGAAREAGEPNHAGRIGGRSVWWTWTAAANGSVTVDTIGSSFDTLLAVYTGGSVSRLSLVAGNDDGGGNGASRLTFAARTGTAYHIAVDGLDGESGSIVLSIRQGLHLTTQPQSQVVSVEGSVTFTVRVLGSTLPSYQWRKDDVALSGATNSVYAITKVQPTHAGTYSVLVRDSAGGTTSSNAVLTVTIPRTFTTWAGTPQFGSRDGKGSEARFVAPSGVAVDNAGIVYVADTGNNTIRKIAPDGTVSTLAGSAGEAGSAEGIGSEARFNFPIGVAVASTGDVYVTDSLNNTVRKITPGGLVSTWAGSVRNVPGKSDGLRTTARFSGPNRLAVDATGNIYVPDTLNHTIRKIAPNGLVSTLAGLAESQGSADGLGSTARFAYPRGLAADTQGHVYVADAGNDAIRKITPDGRVSTLAGLPGTGGAADGTGTAALFADPNGVAVDSAGNVYVADGYNHTIRKITPAGTVSTLAGQAKTSGSEDGTGSAARFNLPTGLAVDRAGAVYVADTGNGTIRKITPDGTVVTLAGKASIGSLDGPGREARFGGFVDGLAADAAGNVYVADFENHTIRKITADGTVATLAGKPGVAGSADGAGAEARFDHPESVAFDSAGSVYVADSHNHTIRKITPDGVVTTLAGLAGSYGSADGLGSAARFFYPFGLAVDNAGYVYVADGYNHTIRKITATGAVSTLAGNPGTAGYADGAGRAARFRVVEGIAVDGAGFIYVADLGNHVIRKVTPDGVVSTLAGAAGFSGNSDGPGNAAGFNQPAGVAVDRLGNVYVADTGNDTIRIITPDGVVGTLAGSAVDSFGSTDGVGGQARFYSPRGVALDGAGNLYVTDASNNTIRKGLPFGIITHPQNQTVGAGGNATFSVAAIGNSPLTYQWFAGGVPLVGQTNATLSLESVRPTDRGPYSVAVTGPAGSVTSSSALLQVLLPQRFEPPQLLANGRLRLRFKNENGGLPDDLSRLELQWRTSLPEGADDKWQTMTAGFFVAGGFVVFDDASAAGQPRRFYRVVER